MFPINIKSLEELFQFLDENQTKYVAFHSLVKIEMDDAGTYKITSVHDSFPIYGLYDNQDLEQDLLNFEDLEEIEKDGYYQFNGISSVHSDDNGVGHVWTFLDMDYVDISFAISIDQLENDSTSECDFEITDLF